MEEIEQIPMTHLVDLAYLFRSGVIGWQADARHSYAQYAQLHNLQQVLVQVNSKNYKAKKPRDFDKIYPIHAELSNLGVKPKVDLAAKWLGTAAKLGAPMHGTDSSKRGGRKGN